MKNSKILATILTLALALALMAPAVFAAPVESDGSAGIKWQTSGFVPVDPPTDPPTDPEDEWFYNNLARSDLYFGEQKIALTNKTYDSVNYTGQTYGRLLGYGASNGTSDNYLVTMEMGGFKDQANQSTMAGFTMKLYLDAANSSVPGKPIVTTGYYADDTSISAGDGGHEMFEIPDLTLAAVNYSGKLNVVAGTVADTVTSASATITWNATVAP